ncbi:MAG: hypothetical protein HHAS10_08780 [Candidatus Altimarinota bacterium]
MYFGVPFKEGVFREETSLLEDLEEAKGEKSSLDFSLLGSICIKYLLVFLMQVDQNERKDVEFVGTQYLKILGEVFGGSLGQQNHRTHFSYPSETHQVIQTIGYQIAMLLDIPSTVAIMQDIISGIETTEGSHFHGWDIGAGSGILGLAQFIGAQRQGKRNIDIKGFEIGPLSQRMADRAYKALGIGEVHLSDTRDPDTYSGLILPSYISNENLPTSGVPFSHHENGITLEEAFLTNIDALSERYGSTQVSQVPQFPRGLEWGNTGDSVVKRSFSSDLYGISIMGRLAKISGLPRDRYIYPSGIFVDNKWVPLYEVGNKFHQYMSKVFQPSRWRKRKGSMLFAGNERVW